MELSRYVIVLALVLPLGLLSFFPSPPPDETDPAVLPVASPPDEVVPSALAEQRDAFGLPRYQFKTVEERVQRRETFSDMLNEHNVS
jgi:hypothetical protein